MVYDIQCTCPVLPDDRCGLTRRFRSQLSFTNCFTSSMLQNSLLSQWNNCNTKLLGSIPFGLLVTEKETMPKRLLQILDVRRRKPVSRERDPSAFRWFLIFWLLAWLLIYTLLLLYRLFHLLQANGIVSFLKRLTILHETLERSAVHPQNADFIQFSHQSPFGLISSDNFQLQYQIKRSRYGYSQLVFVAFLTPHLSPSYIDQYLSLTLCCWAQHRCIYFPTINT